MRQWMIAAAVAVGGAAAGHVFGQTTLPAPIGEFEPYPVDSGVKANLADAAATVHVEIVSVPDAGWLRLYFAEAQLPPGSTIRMTSLRDGETQELDSDGIAMWSYASAYFNGDTVMIELVAGPKTGRNRFVLDKVARQMVNQPIGGCTFPCGICGDDDRVSSNEDWSGRFLPAGCTASVWNEDSCLVSAGHCIFGAMTVQFNVPASNPDCSINNPPVADQFPILATIFSNGGVGNDWAVMTTGTNNLGQTIFERYGLLRAIASSPPAVGETLGVWGFGIDDQCTLSQTQQTHTAEVDSVSGSFFEHTVDITCGSSGSSAIRNNEILGIVTHCPCPGIATRVDLAAFAAARESLCGEGAGIPNDACVDREPIGEGTTAYSTLGAITDGPLHAACEFDGQTYQDIWYNYVAGCSGTLTVTTCAQLGGSADYDSDLVVYDGCNCGNLVLLGCNDDDPANACGGAPSFQSTVQVPVVAGQCYKIRVGGFNPGDQGAGNLNVSNDGSPCGTCGNGVFDPGENCENCPADVMCPPGQGCVGGLCVPLCGNGVIDPGENCSNCPADVQCAPDEECVSGVCQPLCGNGVVDPGEDCANCPADVTCPLGEACVGGVCQPLCGNGVIDAGEDCANCPADVQCAPDEECVSGVCQPLCGNGVLDPGENCETCPADVECPPGQECVGGVCQPLCGNGVVDLGEDCANCPADVPCPPGEECVGGVCQPLCGNGVVDLGEDCANCPADVPCPPGEECVGGVCQPLCGNGVVDLGEDCANCPADVSCPPGEACVGGVCQPLCGNGVIDLGEDCANCPADVSCPPGTVCDSGICRCPEDINGDGTVNVLDLVDLLLCFGLPAVPGCEMEDVTGDGSVNVLDLIDLLLLFGTDCP